MFNNILLLFQWVCVKLRGKIQIQIRIWNSIKKESRIRIGIKTMPIHNPGKTEPSSVNFMLAKAKAKGS
jgi:hypothetical protein